ncbi:hypothetical protein LP417_35595 (plasmid) [Polaromonas sp. P1-6]|nr:hypothetical protein LP417_35595 [Polaromonas sp. P1-6]
MNKLTIDELKTATFPIPASSMFNLPKVTLVRREFTEEADWREALPREPLHVHSAYTGSMDAP